MLQPTTRCTAIALCLLGLGALPLGATNYTITIFDDNFTNGGDCSLREALQAAATNSVRDACAAGTADDLITLPSGTVSWDGGAQTLASPAGTITVAGPTLDRADATVHCQSSGSFLVLTGANVTLRDFSVAWCDAGAGAGGAVDATLSSLSLRNMRFAQNHATDFGGAIRYAWQSGAGAGQLRIEDSLFEGNAADDDSPEVRTPAGGAVLALLDAASGATIVRTQFLQNGVSSATRPTEGAGMKVDATGSSTVTLREVEFSENRCGAFDTNHDGCGLYLRLTEQAQAEVSDALVYGNYALNPGIYARSNGIGVFLNGTATLLAQRLRLDGNVNPGSTSGGEIQLMVEARDTASAVVRDVLAVDGNMGILASGDYGSPTLRLDHLTATGNDTGGSAYLASSATMTVQNSIFWGNSVDDLEVTGSVVQSSNHVGGADPLLVAPGTGDYRLTSASPDRDAGDEALAGVGAFDLAHAPRVVGVETDRGAYEYGGIFGDDFESGDTSAW